MVKSSCKLEEIGQVRNLSRHNRHEILFYVTKIECLISEFSVFLNAQAGSTATSILHRPTRQPARKF